MHDYGDDRTRQRGRTMHGVGVVQLHQWCMRHLGWQTRALVTVVTRVDDRPACPAVCRCWIKNLTSAFQSLNFVSGWSLRDALWV